MSNFSAKSLSNNRDIHVTHYVCVNSEPVPAHRESKQKIVTAQHTVPAAACHLSSADGGDDLVAYERIL